MSTRPITGLLIWHLQAAIGWLDEETQQRLGPLLHDGRRHHDLELVQAVRMLKRAIAADRPDRL